MHVSPSTSIPSRRPRRPRSPIACSLWLFLIGFAVLTADASLVHAQQDDVPAGEEADSPERLAAATKTGEAANDAAYYELMRLFVDTFEQVDRNYVRDVDRRQLMEAAVRGMLNELDPYSNFIAPDQLTEFNEDIEQEFGGIGIQFEYDPEQKQIEVIAPIPGGPAYKSGIKAGDRIVSIEGELIAKFPKGRERETAVQKLKGKPGQKVVVGVRHVGEEETEDVTLTRELIQLPTVRGYDRRGDGSWDYFIDEDDNIAYIRLTHFTRRSGTEMREAIRQLTSEGLDGLILDLRFNPGGLLSAAVDVVDLFLEKGKIVSTAGRNSRDQVWSAKKFGTYSDFPIAVLVNRYSASASEIVSAALQDHDRAVVIGERTWGKGSVQNVIELEQGESALKLTTASYHRPSGKNIHRFPDATEDDEWGVVPNKGYDVKLSQEEMIRLQEFRLSQDTPANSRRETIEFEDKQLQKALEYLRGEINGTSTADASGGDSRDQDDNKNDQNSDDKEDE